MVKGRLTPAENTTAAALELFHYGTRASLEANRVKGTDHEFI